MEGNVVPRTVRAKRALRFLPQRWHVDQSEFKVHHVFCAIGRIFWFNYSIGKMDYREGLF